MPLLSRHDRLPSASGGVAPGIPGGQAMEQVDVTESGCCILRHGCARAIGCVVRLVILFLFLFSALMVGIARAGELNLLINGRAIHLNPPAGKNLNERNWGLGIQYDWTSHGGWVPFATASGFRDSNRHPSYYAGGGVLRRWEVRGLHADVGIVGFVMTRKDFKDDRPFPGLLPALSVGTQRVAVNMTYIPKVHPKAVPLWFFQLKIGLAGI
jgi:hypothetical protein